MEEVRKHGSEVDSWSQRKKERSQATRETEVTGRRENERKKRIRDEFEEEEEEGKTCNLHEGKKKDPPDRERLQGR